MNEDVKKIQDIIKRGCASGRPYPWCSKDVDCASKACWYHEAKEICQLLPKAEVVTKETIKRTFGQDVANQFDKAKVVEPDEGRLLPDKELLKEYKYPDLVCLERLQNIAKAQRDLTASIKDARYRQAVKDSRDGKELDLTEEEFEVFCSIENLHIDRISKVKDAEIKESDRVKLELTATIGGYIQRVGAKDAECQQKIEEIFREIDKLINTYSYEDGSFISLTDSLRALKDRIKKEEK